MEDGRAFAWANARDVPCNIGGRVYSSSLYGDMLDASPDGLIRLKGSREGRHDAPMLSAFREGRGVLVTRHIGSGNTLPRQIGFGTIVSVEDGTNTKREFVIRLESRSEDASHATARRDVGVPKSFWKKRRFMVNKGLVLESGSLLNSFVTVRCAHQDPPEDS